MSAGGTHWGGKWASEGRLQNGKARCKPGVVNSLELQSAEPNSEASGEGVGDKWFWTIKQNEEKRSLAALVFLIKGRYHQWSS